LLLQLGLRHAVLVPPVIKLPVDLGDDFAACQAVSRRALSSENLSNRNSTLDPSCRLVTRPALPYPSNYSRIKPA
jgi:hypothetical protein